MKSSTTIPTANGRRYMIQLCKHFGHRVPATFNDREGEVVFEMGKVGLRAAPETLMIVAEAEAPEGLDRLEGVVASHLKRFAFREPDLAVDWRRAH
ncbi:MAG: DUF2218 domain-containing protein [Proteobacteria bacterium]|nr:DUF2218 domain-containing protein [Pseudomonadota bacterium]